MRDDEVLGRILRRFLTDEDDYASTSTGELVLDGWIRLDAEERAIVDRVLHPEAVRQVRTGETFDLAPGETVDVMAGGECLVRVHGGPGGMKGARVG